MGEKPICELVIENGRSINTTGNPPYLVRVFVKGGYVLKAKGEIMNNLPLNSDDLTFSNNLDNSERVMSINGGVIFNFVSKKSPS
ncbi:hypothetical protein COU61_04765 [Candidatus Pacearchaeota archaeon CG10_big_fil_rev_8_21_14_0_10_35_13]|nr:MAG: hypothetical protein COU61_04765 [Candidatus Pacearchaeota archaeon CG10_big_fil_rev_8_21_14_0_10_35_13]